MWKYPYFSDSGSNSVTRPEMRAAIRFSETSVSLSGDSLNRFLKPFTTTE